MGNPVEQFFYCVGNGDIAAALELVSDDVVFEAQGPSSTPVYGVFKGKEGVKEFLATISSLYETETFEFIKTVEVDGYVFSHGYMKHHVRPTNRVFECEWALVCQIENGVITSYKMFDDTAAAKEAIGR